MASSTAASYNPSRDDFAAMLDEWHAAAHRLSEQIGLRFFSHVGEASTQTFAT